MHESIFSYGLVRPYPFKWLTPIVIVGGILATVLFSFINVAATGYDMVAVETSDPNSTIAEKTFFSNWPSLFVGNTRSSCESKILGVNNIYYTTNAALSYKVDSISQGGDEGDPKNFGDVPYHNNALRNCTLPKVEIFFRGIERTASQIAQQQWGAELFARIDCIVDIPEGTRTIKLTTAYDLNSASIRFPGRNEKAKSSIWWGESLLAWNYVKLTRDMSMATRDAETKSYKGYINFAPSQGVEIGAEEFMSPYPPPGCFFLPFSDDGVLRTIQYCTDSVEERPYKEAELWASAETITKIFHSTILTDLGQPNPNILVNQEWLKHFSKDIDSIAALQNSGMDVWGAGNNFKLSDYSGLADLTFGPYTSDNASNWRLAADPSYISVTYLCQVPKLKSGGSLFISVLIADLVFLQALWKLFTLIVDFFLYRRHPESGSCKRCGEVQETEDEAFEMLRPSSSAPDAPRGNRSGTAYAPI